jgi:hypothetical protein
LMLSLLDVTSMATLIRSPILLSSYLCFDNVEWSCGNFSTWQSYGTQTCFCHLHCAPCRLAFFCCPHWANLKYTSLSLDHLHCAFYTGSGYLLQMSWHGTKIGATRQHGDKYCKICRTSSAWVIGARCVQMYQALAWFIPPCISLWLISQASLMEFSTWCQSLLLSGIMQ